MRLLGVGLCLFMLGTSDARGEFRLVSDLVSTAAVGAQGGTFRLQGSAGESPSGTVANPPWVLQEGFWFLWRAVTGIAEPLPLPSQNFDFQLDQNAPNPFNPVTRIPFVVPSGTDQRVPTRLDIVDVHGRLVCTLINEPLSNGAHVATWSGHDHAGQLVGSGVYFYRLRIGGQTATRQLVVLK